MQRHFVEGVRTNVPELVVAEIENVQTVDQTDPLGRQLRNLVKAQVEELQFGQVWNLDDIYQVIAQINSAQARQGTQIAQVRDAVVLQLKSVQRQGEREQVCVNKFYGTVGEIQNLQLGETVKEILADVREKIAV